MTIKILSLVYNKLFEVNFDRKDYLNASNYLDSVLNIIDTNTKDFCIK